MNISEYVAGVVETLAPGTQKDHLSAAAIAFPAEAWELLKVLVLHPDWAPHRVRTAFVDELGDLYWYAALACMELGLSFEDLLWKGRPQYDYSGAGQLSGQYAELREMTTYVGIAASDLGDELKKELYHGHGLDESTIARLLVTLLRTLSRVGSYWDASRDEVLAYNVNKLRVKRYQGGFSPERSLSRGEA